MISHRRADAITGRITFSQITDDAIATFLEQALPLPEQMT